MVDGYCRLMRKRTDFYTHGFAVQASLHLLVCCEKEWTVEKRTVPKHDI